MCVCVYIYNPRPVLLNKTRGLRYLGEVPEVGEPIVFSFYCVHFFVNKMGSGT